MVPPLSCLPSSILPHTSFPASFLTVNNIPLKTIVLHLPWPHCTLFNAAMIYHRDETGPAHNDQSVHKSRSLGEAYSYRTMSPASETMSSIRKEESNLPPADYGKAAWLFLFGCLWVEGLVWGKRIYHTMKLSLLTHFNRSSILLWRLPKALLQS